MKKILIPVDNENQCSKTVAMAKDLAVKYGAEIVVLHVNHLIELISHPYAKNHTPEEIEASMELSKQMVEKAAQNFDGAGLKVSTEVIKGDAATEIIDYAEKTNCDLIVMCSHGHGAVRRFLIGGVTSKVVHHATVPVMVVR